MILKSSFLGNHQNHSSIQMKAPRSPVRRPRQHYPDWETQYEWLEWFPLISNLPLSLNTDSPLISQDNYNNKLL